MHGALKVMHEWAEVLMPALGLRAVVLSGTLNSRVYKVRTAGDPAHSSAPLMEHTWFAHCDQGNAEGKTAGGKHPVEAHRRVRAQHHAPSSCCSVALPGAVAHCPSHAIPNMLSIIHSTAVSSSAQQLTNQQLPDACRQAPCWLACGRD